MAKSFQEKTSLLQCNATDNVTANNETLCLWELGNQIPKSTIVVFTMHNRTTFYFFCSTKTHFPVQPSGALQRCFLANWNPRTAFCFLPPVAPRLGTPHQQWEQENGEGQVHRAGMISEYKMVRVTAFFCQKTEVNKKPKMWSCDCGGGSGYWNFETVVNGPGEILLNFHGPWATSHKLSTICRSVNIQDTLEDISYLQKLLKVKSALLSLSHWKVTGLDGYL